MQTAYASIDVLCGYTLILMHEEGKTLDYYSKEDNSKTFGVAYGNSFKKTEYVKNTQKGVKVS